MKKFILTLFAFCAALCYGAEVKLSEIKHGELRLIQVENPFFRIRITPQIGGKICYWHDKVSNTTFVKKELPKTLVAPLSHFGMLDDRGDFVNKEYECQTAELADEGKVLIRLSAFSDRSKIKVIKTLTIAADSPVLNVRYKYENYSDINVIGFALGIRNFFFPSGNDVSSNDRYFFPTTHTLRRLHGYTHVDESGESKPEMAGKLDSCLGAPYNALLNIPKQCGLAISYEDDYYTGFFIWKAGVKYPTYEWTFNYLPAGHSRETEFNIIQVNNMDSVAYAARNMLSAVKITKDDKKVAVKTDLKFLRSEKSAMRLEINCRAIGRKWTAKAKSFSIKGVEAGKKISFNADFILPTKGLFEVEHRLYRKNVLTDSWREAVTCGRFTSLPIYTFKGRKVVETKPIPGWKAPDAPAEEVNDTDRKRGFTVFEPLHNNRYNKCRKVELTIARNEFESVELILGNLNYLGKISVETVNPGNFPVQLRVRRNLVRGGAGRGVRIARILFNDKNFEPEAKHPVWITVGSKTNPPAPGVYNFSVKFTGRNNTMIEIPVKVTVVDVTFPHRNLVNLESEGYPQLYPGVKKSQILNTWYRNMQDHGIDFFQFVRRGRGFNPKTYDYFIDNAMRHGLVIFKSARYSINPASPGEEKFWQQMGEYVRQKGYQNKDMFIKILDEQPAEKYQAMAAAGKWLKAAGFRPFSTFHNLFNRPQALKLLAGVFDMFQGGYTTKAELQERLKDGTLKPGDRFCHYTGTGASPRSYTEMLFWGVQAAVLEHDLFHNHEYMRKGNRGLLSNSVYVDTDNCPRDAVSHEGLRDGMDIAQLAALYRSWSKLLDADKKAALDKRFDKIIGKKDSIFPMVIIKDMGVTREVTSEVKLANYRRGREALLLLVLEVKNLLGAKLNDSAVLRWNNKIIAGKNIVPQFVAAAKLPAENNAINDFISAFAAKTGIALAGKPGSKGVTITFKQAKTTGSYRIIYDGKNSIVIQAATPENLRLGAENWINTMDIGWEK